MSHSEAAVSAAASAAASAEAAAASAELATQIAGHPHLTTGVHGVAGDVVGTSDTQTLTGKTISADNNTINGFAASSFVVSDGTGKADGSAAQKAVPAGAVVGTTDSQTLTNKTLAAATNVLNGFTASRFMESDGTGKIVSGSKVIPAGAVVGTSDTQTLSGKSFSDLVNATAGINVRIPNGKLSADAPSTYPAGFSAASVTSGANGWPVSGTVFTLVHESGTYCSQILVANGSDGVVYVRRSNNAASWQPWVQLSTETARPYTQRWQTSGQSISNNAVNLVTFGSSANTVGIGYSAGVFTVPEAGLYSINAGIGFVAAAGGRRMTQIKINGTAEAESSQTAGNVSVEGATVSGTFRLAANDTVEIGAYQNSGAALNTHGAKSTCFVTIAKVSA